jgi:hypothetical protein
LIGFNDDRICRGKPWTLSEQLLVEEQSGQTCRDILLKSKLCEYASSVIIRAYLLHHMKGAFDELGARFLTV